MPHVIKIDYKLPTASLLLTALEKEILGDALAGMVFNEELCRKTAEKLRAGQELEFEEFMLAVSAVERWILEVYKRRGFQVETPVLGLREKLQAAKKLYLPLLTVPITPDMLVRGPK
jgi:hypothetical protein